MRIESEQKIRKSEHGYPEKIESREIRIEKGSLVLLIGAPASGKSSFARKNFPLDSIVSTDAIRGELTNNPGNQDISTLAFILGGKLVKSRLANGKVTVIDAMNLNIHSRSVFTKIAQECGAKIIGIHLDYPEQIIKERNRKRKKEVDEDFIEHKLKHETDNNLLYHDKSISQIFVIKDETEDVNVALPSEDQQEMQSDQEFYHETQKAEADALAFWKAHREKLEKENVRRIEIMPRSLNFIQDSSSARKFLENNTLSSQVVDLNFYAKRLGTSVDDPIVRETVGYLIKRRAELNLISFLLHSKDAGAIAEKIKDFVKDKYENISHIEDKPEVLEEAIMDVQRGLKDEKLVVLGDVHGCLTALQEIYAKVHQENLERSRKKNGVEKEDLELDDIDDEATRKSKIQKRMAIPYENERKFVFVGDIPDRGPFSAETILFVTSLVRNREAVWIMGNHDVNLRSGLELVAQKFQESGKNWEDWLKNYFSESILQETVRSRETRKTIVNLLEFRKIEEKDGSKLKEQPRIKYSSLEKIIDVLKNAPVYKEWKHLVAIHASLRKVPRDPSELTPEEAKKFTHGIRSFINPVNEVMKLRNASAKDPDRIAVGGHTHDEKIKIGSDAGTIGLDAGTDLQAMYYPEMEFLSAKEPKIEELAEVMFGTDLPQGEKLLELVDYLQSQLMLQTNTGPKGSPFEGLTIASYHENVEMRNLWSRYPVLRNFRGLIFDKKGNIIARPFKKTHKAKVEIPLDELNMVPDKIFEKANGTMGICYFWKGEWRIATKLSLFNEGYTVPATEMIHQMNTEALDVDNTYLFEIILPEDPHFVDYKKERKMIMLNAGNTKNGADLSWEVVESSAKELGCATAADMTDKFKGMTIAEIYEFAQKSGNLKNLEGLMAVYLDAKNGEQTTVKIKTREYDDKKFVRDKLKWKKIFDNFDWKAMDIPEEKKEALLFYNLDNDFAKAALDVRIDWIRGEFERMQNEFFEKYDSLLKIAEKAFREAKDEKGENEPDAIKAALRIASDEYKLRYSEDKSRGSVLGYIRSHFMSQSFDLGNYIKEKIGNKIEAETSKRGHAAYWLTPED
jgi:predicted kinase